MMLQRKGIRVWSSLRASAFREASSQLMSRAAAGGAAAAAGDFRLGLRPRDWLDVINVVISISISTASWHVDLPGSP